MATKKEIEIKLKSTLDGKGVEEAKQQIDALNKSTEQLDKDSKQATRSVKNMGQGALQGKLQGYPAYQQQQIELQKNQLGLDATKARLAALQGLSQPGGQPASPTPGGFHL